MIKTLFIFPFIFSSLFCNKKDDIGYVKIFNIIKENKSVLKCNFSQQDKLINCNKCNISGNIKCSKCNATGRIERFKVSYKLGFLKFDFIAWKSCIDCNRTGMIKCMYCKGKRLLS